MSRLQGIDDHRAGLLTRIAYALSRRTSKRKVGEAVVPEPVRILAHNTKVLQGYGVLETMLDRSRSVPQRLRLIARETVAPMTGCPW